MKKALLIDDEERMLELLALYLEPYQYDCRKALGAKEGLQYIEEERFALKTTIIINHTLEKITP